MIDYAIVTGELDPECIRCHDCIDSRGVLLLHDGDPICTGCAGPAATQVAQGLQAVYDVIALDADQPTELDAIATALRHLSEVATRIRRGDITVRRRVTIPAEPWGPGRPAGIHVDYELSNL